LSVVIVGAARMAKALTASGTVAAAVVGFLLFGLGGGQGAAALLVFFLTSSALSRVGKRRKDALQFEKGGERDAGQVLANGGVAAACALLLPLLPDARWPVAALLGALAAANADTWATEIGALAKAPPRLITNFRPAPPGSSGAISLPGTLAALAGATLIGAIAPFWDLGVPGLVAVTIGGLFGSLLDSLLGATVQVQYRDADTGKLTERTETPGGKPNERARGLPWLVNDLVNAAATLFGALMAAALYGNLS
jgi:uncharacterized protein (TIGR00297 family)